MSGGGGTDVPGRSGGGGGLLPLGGAGQPRGVHPPGKRAEPVLRRRAAVVDELAAAVAQVAGRPTDRRCGSGWPTASSPRCWRPGPSWSSPRGAPPDFLAPWSVAVLRRPDLAVTLRRLGVHTLGQFAALAGRRCRPASGRTPPPATGWPGGRRGAGRAPRPRDHRRLRVAGGAATEARASPASSAGPRPPTPGPPGRSPGSSSAWGRGPCSWGAWRWAGPGRAGPSRALGQPGRRTPAPTGPGDPRPPPGPAGCRRRRPSRSSARRPPAEVVDAGGRPGAGQRPGAAHGRAGRAVGRRRVRGAHGGGLGRALAGDRTVVVDAGAGARLQVVTGRGAALCWPPRRSAGGWRRLRLSRARPYAELHCPLGLQLPRRRQRPRGAGGRGPPAGARALALTDHHGLYGVVRFAEAARAVGLPDRLRGRGDPGAGRVRAPVSPTRPGTTWCCWPGTPRATPALDRPGRRPPGGGEKGRPVFTLDGPGGGARRATGWC